MLYFYVLIITQIVIESFPISSSGHVMLAQKIFDYMYGPVVCGALDMSDALVHDMVMHFLHGPTIIVIAIFFARRWFFLLCNYARCWWIIITIIGLTIVADTVTVALFLFFQVVDVSSFPVVIGFAITAVGLSSLYFCPTRSYGTLTWKKALVIGAVQGIALLPGISRLGGTYVIARWLRLSPRTSLEVSFLLQLPLICAGFVHSVFRLGPSTIKQMLGVQGMPLVIFLASTCAYVGLCCVAWCVQKNKMWLFGLYMIIPISLWIML